MPIKIKSLFPPHVKLILKLYGLHVVIFSFYHLLHYVINQPLDISEVPIGQKIWSFRMGLEFDSALIAYGMFIPVLLLGSNYFFNYKFRILNLISICFFVIVMLAGEFVCSADIPYYKQFGNHIDRNVFLWNDKPEFATGLIFGDIGYWGYIFVFLFTAFFSIYFSRKFYKIFKAQAAMYPPASSIQTSLFFLVLCVINFYVVRGRTSPKTPLHEGLAIVSTNSFVNSIAVNPNFTFWKSLFRNKKPYVVPGEIQEYLQFTRNYLKSDSSDMPVISRKVNKYSSPKKCNVVVVIMESMSVFKMGYYKGKNLTPNFHKIIRESVFFDHFFSSGIHTFNGLFSTTSGYPSVLDEQPLREYLKKPFEGMGPLLKKQGYDTWFFTSHDPHFDNMQGFFVNNAFTHIISQYQMPAGSAVSELGVPDHVLFEQAIRNINERPATEPFLSVVLTSSDHGPWVVPENIPFKPAGETIQENCTLYADWSLGKFMSDAKKQPWYQNTIFIFLGDHGLSMGHTYEMPLSFNHVPFVVHMAGLNPGINPNLGYQPDVPATIMGLLNLNYTNETFGTNLFEEGHPYVMFSADNKIGCINNRGFYFYKLLNTGINRLWKYENLDKTEYINTYRSMADSMDYASNAILETARYLIRKNNYGN